MVLSASGSSLGGKYAKLMWCNPRQPCFASVFCVSVKDPGALVVIKKSEKIEGLPELQHKVIEILSGMSARFQSNF